MPFLAGLVGSAKLATAVASSGVEILWARGGARRDAVKARVLRRTLGGLSEVDFEARGRAFAHDLHRRLRADTVARMGWHRDQGHDLALVSASLGAYLRPFGTAQGFATIIAVEMEVGADARLTGETTGPNVRGPEKARRLAGWLEGRSLTWAYGDSSGDTAMFDLAEHPIRVGRRTLAPAPCGLGRDG